MRLRDDQNWSRGFQTKLDLVLAFCFSLLLHNRNVRTLDCLTIQPQIWENLATTARLGLTKGQFIKGT